MFLFLIFQILVVSFAKDASESKKSKNNNNALKYKDEADNYYKQKKYREVCFLRSLLYCRQKGCIQSVFFLILRWLLAIIVGIYAG